MPNLFTSFMRTATPIVAGLVLGLAAKVGFSIDDATVTAFVISGLTALYYAAFRLAEHAAASAGKGWLATAAGVLLGWARPPEYPKS